MKSFFTVLALGGVLALVATSRFPDSAVEAEQVSTTLPSPKSEPLAVDLVSTAEPRSPIERLLGMEKEDRVEAVESFLFELDEEDVASVLALITDNRADKDVRSAAFAHLVGQPDAARLPALVRIASLEPVSPLREDAVVLLRRSLGFDYGENWAGWIDAVQYELDGMLDDEASG